MRVWSGNVHSNEFDPGLLPQCLKAKRGRETKSGKTMSFGPHSRICKTRVEVVLPDGATGNSQPSPVICTAQSCNVVTSDDV